jgi:hypothetical protein
VKPPSGTAERFIENIELKKTNKDIFKIFIFSPLLIKD